MHLRKKKYIYLLRFKMKKSFKYVAVKLFIASSGQLIPPNRQIMFSLTGNIFLREYKEIY